MSSETISSKTAFMLAAITMCGADGNIDELEIDAVAHLYLGRHNNSFQEANEIWKSSSFSDCINIVAYSLNYEQKLYTLSHILDIGMVSGALGEYEKDLFETFIKVFNLEHSDAMKIIEVIGLKNNHSIF